MEHNIPPHGWGLYSVTHSKCLCKASNQIFLWIRLWVILFCMQDIAFAATKSSQGLNVLHHMATSRVPPAKFTSPGKNSHELESSSLQPHKLPGSFSPAFIPAQLSSSASTIRANGAPKKWSEPKSSTLRSPLRKRLKTGTLSMAVSVEGDKVNGKSVKDWTVERTLFQALHMATAEEMDRDKNVCVIGEDVGHYGGSYKVTKDLHYRYGHYRIFDTPICENTFTGMAIGASMAGLRPIVEGMNMGFLLLAFNQIANNAGMVRYTSGGNFEVPLVMRGPGGIGKQLGPEHSQRIEAYLMAVPGLKLVACSTPYNARGLLKSAIRENNPVVFFEHVLLYNLKEEIPLLPYTLPLDKAELVRHGKDVTILSYSRMRHVAAEAAQRLSRLGIEAEVIDLISLKPLDMDTIKKSIKKTHKCIILDESSKTGGIGGEIFAQIMENCANDLDEVPIRLCTKDIPTPYNKYFEEATIVTPDDVVNSLLWMVSSRNKGSATQIQPTAIKSL
ncbi:pyruvate dehydrogenase complex subunit PD-HE1Beta [Cardiosporidium cionae]|uniref:Pyruvate dehydrogenase complex subunit PD-HE1Beta n=1 Tax=Cardiosporidium cionae TaxID=476202 RepID=A0ABQ7JGG5_9APIC|nr:pyruvate dehydrogenase complex subunit PD-HE1Beta [Cardiosporidium cionae]|eukprot:KAF8823061.1 pyruvate dehydrogenase complex subunit PD-HE1Beta [Cardiosporidium cionae]